MHRIKTILWDWNGTLLNDLGVCVESINTMLSGRGMPTLSKSRYLQIFTFPVKDYYEKAGFNFQVESWETAAMEFMDLYREKVAACGIHQDAIKTLEGFRQEGYDQYLVSAMEHEFLIDLTHRLGVRHYFRDVAGIQDHYANGKEEMAARFCAINRIDPRHSVFIGDTLHDYEVAQALAMDCVLVAAGHQSRERLLSKDCPVVDNLSELKDLLKNGFAEVA